MNVLRIKDLLLLIYGKYRLAQVYNKYKSTVTIKKLTKEQQKAAKDYYLNEFGVKIDTKYHELIYSICDVFKPEYMPFDIYNQLIERLSPYRFKKVLDDKALYHWILPGVNTPERVLFCCNGVYYKPEKGGISEILREEAISVAANIDNCIIKPSKESSAGIGVKGVSTQNGIIAGTQITIGNLMDSYNGNFVIEKKVRNNENLRKHNDTSCNTLRVHTWRNKTTGDIVFVSSFLRVGRKGAIIDNAFAGGIAIPIGNDGCLSNSGCTFNKYHRLETSDTGVTFKGYKIDQFDEIVDAVKKAHKNLPHFDYIGWDVTVNDRNEVVIIEFNPDPDMRLDQLIFLDTCLLSHQKEILNVVLE